MATITTRYHTVRGQIRAQASSATFPSQVLLPDALGSTTQSIDGSEPVSTSSTTRYLAFGELSYLSCVTVSSKMRFAGSLGYREICRQYAEVDLRHRIYSKKQSRFTSAVNLNELLSGERAYTYANSNPVLETDPSGQRPSRFTANGVAHCLTNYTSRCQLHSKRHSGKADVSLALCVFWQESDLGQKSKSDGMGSVTKVAFDDLRKVKNCWLQKYSNYQDFLRGASSCEKARAAYDYLDRVGLDHYGPGPGQPGDYRGLTGKRVLECQDCLNGGAIHVCNHDFGGPPPPFDQIASYCFRKIHR